jgi:hypothetical protein|tara:strand:- start:6137 stop:7333 length:1197 start_codon:yes stop_codon:yes gene_type:complete
MERLRYSGLTSVNSLGEILTVGETLFERPSPLDLCGFLKDCQRLLWVRQNKSKCDICDVEERLISPVRLFFKKLLCEFRAGSEDILFKSANPNVSIWSYGTLMWCTHAQLIYLSKSPPMPKLDTVRSLLFLKDVCISEMSWADAVDVLDAISIRFKELVDYKEVGVLLLALEWRLSTLFCTGETDPKSVQECAHFFIYFHRSMWAMNYWPPLESENGLIKASEKELLKIVGLCTRYVDNRGFRKKLLNLFYKLSCRQSDSVRSEGGKSANKLQACRSQSWYYTMQRNAYKLQVAELLKESNFATSLVLNAMDMYMKSLYELPFLSYFCIYQESMIVQLTKMRGYSYPLIYMGDGGVYLFYKRQMSAKASVIECVVNWFRIIKSDHNNVLFKNIAIKSP